VSALAEALQGGGKAFVPYVTGGLPGVDAPLLRELAACGADAIEVGIPFSDPIMDGPVIQGASTRALEAGTTPGSVLSTIAEADVDVPVAVMTYLNPVLSAGFDRFAADAAAAGVAGVIVPDLPVDESDDWRAACAANGLDAVLLAAPGLGEERLATIARASSGFVYCVGRYGVTGEADAAEQEGTAEALVEHLRPHTDLPLLVGVGISSPDLAADACRFADGVVVGTALVKPLLDDDREAMLTLARAFRGTVR
jgi:tryptophan synthase alpha chain